MPKIIRIDVSKILFEQFLQTKEHHTEVLTPLPDDAKLFHVGTEPGCDAHKQDIISLFFYSDQGKEMEERCYLWHVPPTEMTFKDLKVKTRSTRVIRKSAERATVVNNFEGNDCDNPILDVKQYIDIDIMYKELGLK